MSHTMNIKVQLNDLEALKETCSRLGILWKEGQHDLFSTTEKGFGMYLPNWKYPAVVKDDGSVACDTYNGRWGNMAELKKVEAYYGITKATIEARSKGYWVTEEIDETTKEIVLTINL